MEKYLAGVVNESQIFSRPVRPGYLVVRPDKNTFVFGYVVFLMGFTRAVLK